MAKKTEYVSLKALKAGKKTKGGIKATITGVNEKEAKGFHIVELTVNDGTAEMTLSMFNPSLQFSEDDKLNVSDVYIKEYKGVNQLAVSKWGKVTLNEEEGEEDDVSSEPEEEPEFPKKPVRKPLVVNEGSKQSMQSTTQSENEMGAKIVAQITVCFKELFDLLSDFKVAVLDQMKINAGIVKNETIELEASEPEDGQ